MLLSLLCLSCKDHDEISTTLLIGSWQYVNIEYFECDGAGTYEIFSCGNSGCAVWVFTETNLTVSEPDGSSETFEYDFNGSMLKIFEPNGIESLSFVVEIKESILKLTYHDKSDPLIPGPCLWVITLQNDSCKIIGM